MDGDMSAERSRTWGVPAVGEPYVSTPAMDAALDEWLCGSSVLVVQAPSGYGKTTTVAHWLASRDPSQPVVWISCGPWIRTWGEALAALDAALTRIGISAPPGTGGAGSITLARLLGTEQTVIVVYDDYDLLPDAPDTVKQVLADRQLRGVRTVMIRSGPDRRVLSEEPAGVTVLSMEDLRWGPTTTQHAVSRVGETR